jgi:hypothetical protein
MVDQSGHPVYAESPSVSVFGATASTVNSEPTQTTAASALMTATAAAVQATAGATGHNLVPEHIKDQQAIQAGLDSKSS